MAQRIVIIGNGVAGITAARHIRKLGDDEITVISAETDHFFSRTALMYIYMGHMSYEDTKPYDDAFWDRNRLGLERAYMRRVELADKLLHLDDGRRMSYDALLVASGSKSNQFGWPGQELDGVQGLYGYPDLQRMERSTAHTEHAVVVGGGLIGVETAEMLLSRGIAVTFLVRESAWMDFAFPGEESELIAREIRAHGVDLRLSTELERIVPDGQGGVRSVLTRSGEEIACQFVALTVGVSPRIDFLSDSGIECDRGVLVDEYLRTSAADVYAAGDCAQLRRPVAGRRAIEPVWYVGRRMGRTVARTICGRPTPYDQGIWFNSAKFLDLEWQVYGDVPARTPAGVETVHWWDPDGGKSIRINYRASDGAVLGFNLIGVRYRHELCHEWVEQGRSIRFVLEHLGAANFDPELFRQHEADLVDTYNATHADRPVHLRRRRGLRSLWSARQAT